MDIEKRGNFIRTTDAGVVVEHCTTSRQMSLAEAEPDKGIRDAVTEALGGEEPDNFVADRHVGNDTPSFDRPEDKEAEIEEALAAQIERHIKDRQ